MLNHINSNIGKSAVAIWDFLKINDLKEEKADFIFILGGSSLAPVHKAAELYYYGYAKRIAFISIGGHFGGQKIWGMSEMKKYKEVLKRSGLVEPIVVSEELSNNTLSEAQQAIPFMLEYEKKLQKIILVSRPIHQRRAFATFQKQWEHLKSIKFINCPADEELLLYEKNTLQRLIDEVDRLVLYGKKGDLKSQKIEQTVFTAMTVIRDYLKVN